MPEEPINFSYEGRRLFSIRNRPLEGVIVLERFGALETLVKLPQGALLETDKAAVEYGDVRNELLVTAPAIYLSEEAWRQAVADEHRAARVKPKLRIARSH